MTRHAPLSDPTASAERAIARGPRAPSLSDGPRKASENEQRRKAQTTQTQFADSEGSTLTRESAPPHHLEVIRKGGAIVSECEEALGLRFITRDKLKALLGVSVELNKVLMGNAVVGKVEREEAA